MKAMVLTGIRAMELVDRPEPRLEGENEVLLQVERIGICGSDVHYYTTGRIGSQVVEYPFAVGHECAATVLETGKGVTRVRAGDRVVVDPAVHCGRCDQCRCGRPHTCRALRFLGCPGQLDGCLAERIVLPDFCCFLMPEGMRWDEGALCEPLAIGLYASRLGGAPEAERIAILGAGPIGLSVLAAAQAEGGAEVFVTEPIPERRSFALRQGAAWAGDPRTEDVVAEVGARAPGGVDLAFECAGTQETLDQGLAMLRPGGKLMLIGIPEFDRYSFPADRARRNELCLQEVRRQNGCTGDAVALVASKRLKLEGWATHRYGLTEAREGFEQVAAYAGGVIKAMIGG